MSKTLSPAQELVLGKLNELAEILAIQPHPDSPEGTVWTLRTPAKAGLNLFQPGKDVAHMHIALASDTEQAKLGLVFQAAGIECLPDFAKGIRIDEAQYGQINDKLLADAAARMEAAADPATALEMLNRTVPYRGIVPVDGGTARPQWKMHQLTDDVPLPHARLIAGSHPDFPLYAHALAATGDLFHFGMQSNYIAIPALNFVSLTPEWVEDVGDHYLAFKLASPEAAKLANNAALQEAAGRPGLVIQLLRELVG